MEGLSFATRLSERNEFRVSPRRCRERKYHRTWAMFGVRRRSSFSASATKEYNSVGQWMDLDCDVLLPRVRRSRGQWERLPAATGSDGRLRNMRKHQLGLQADSGCTDRDVSSKLQHTYTVHVLGRQGHPENQEYVLWNSKPIVLCSLQFFRTSKIIASKIIARRKKFCIVDFSC